MSKVIANDHLWTDEEVEYQLVRNRRSLVEANRDLFLNAEPEPILPADQAAASEDASGAETQGVDDDLWQKVSNASEAQVDKGLAKRGAEVGPDVDENRITLAHLMQQERDAQHN